MSKGYSLERFQSLVEEFRLREDRLLGIKAGEYARDGDRLENFHLQGAFQGVRPEEVALTHFLKHVCAITKAVREARYDWCWESDGKEGLKQRIADARNYLLLIAACIEERVKIEGSCRFWSATKPGCTLLNDEPCWKCGRFEQAS